MPNLEKTPRITGIVRGFNEGVPEASLNGNVTVINLFAAGGRSKMPNGTK
jgi:hypothetical protein